MSENRKQRRRDAAVDDFLAYAVETFGEPPESVRIWADQLLAEVALRTKTGRASIEIEASAKGAETGA
jgi:hypothetical protein